MLAKAQAANKKLDLRRASREDQTLACVFARSCLGVDPLSILVLGSSLNNDSLEVAPITRNS